MSSLVYGVGVNDFKSRVKINNTLIYEYKLWIGMLQRCYSSEFLTRCPSYEGVKVEKHLLSFNNFYNFIRSLDGFGFCDDNGKIYHLDKDILVKGNKLYSKDTCCFVPQEVNKFFCKSEKIRGDLPVGVSYDRIHKKYKSYIKINKKIKTIGYYDHMLDAFISYKAEKENQARILAEKWNGRIDKRVYDKLMSFEVSISD